MLRANRITKLDPHVESVSSPFKRFEGKNSFLDIDLKKVVIYKKATFLNLSLLVAVYFSKLNS